MKLTKAQLREIIREELLKESGEERRILSIENMKQGQTIGDKKMKLTKSKLKEIIREEIQDLNEGLPWEQELDENWFTDLGAKAKKLYIKANPNSKYAGGGEKKKELDWDSDYRDFSKEEPISKQIAQAKARGRAKGKKKKQELILTTEESKNDDPAERKKAMKDI